MSEKVFVLDTSAIIGGFTPNLEEAKQYTVPRVLEETDSLSVQLKLETAISAGRVKVDEPTQEALEKVEERVEETKDRVSRTDIDILALAVRLKDSGKDPEVVTDDYAIQNLAEILEIDYSQVAQPGITDVYEWEWECPACGRVYDEDVKKCQVCGSRLVRKPKD